MPTRTLTADGKEWRVFPSGYITQYVHDEFGIMFIAGTGDTREVTVSKSLLEAYEREHEKYCKELEDYCTKYAMPFFRTHTSIPFDELVLKIFRSGGFLR